MKCFSILTLIILMLAFMACGQAHATCPVSVQASVVDPGAYASAPFQQSFSLQHSFSQQTYASAPAVFQQSAPVFLQQPAAVFAPGINLQVGRRGFLPSRERIVIRHRRF